MIKFFQYIIHSSKKVNTTKFYLYTLIVGAVSGLFATFFSFIISFLTDYLLNLNINNFLLQVHLDFFIQHRFWFLIFPPLGGLLVGFIVYKFPKDLPLSGGDMMLDAFHHRYTSISFKSVILRVVTTIITLVSGGSGGARGPFVTYWIWDWFFDFSKIGSWFKST